MLNLTQPPIDFCELFVYNKPEGCDENGKEAKALRSLAKSLQR